MKFLKLFFLYMLNFLLLLLIFKDIDYSNFLISLQLIIIEYYLYKSLYLFIEYINIKNKTPKINKDDKEKYKYFRDKLNDLTIGEIGYLYNKSNTNELIAATLESLQLRNIIKLENKKIIYDNKSKLNLEEEYLINNFSNIKNDMTKEKFKETINRSLVKKGYVANHTRVAQVLGPQLVFIIWTFLIGYGTGLVYENKLKLWLNAIGFLVFFVIFLSYLLQCSFLDSKICISTAKGKELYLKLLGLKNFINDFGAFGEKSLAEISLWEEYILYAIILNCSDKLDKNLEKKYRQLLEMIS